MRPWVLQWGKHFLFVRRGVGALMRRTRGPSNYIAMYLIHAGQCVPETFCIGSDALVSPPYQREGRARICFCLVVTGSVEDLGFVIRAVGHAARAANLPIPPFAPPGHVVVCDCCRPWQCEWPRCCLSCAPARTRGDPYLKIGTLTIRLMGAHPTAGGGTHAHTPHRWARDSGAEAIGRRAVGTWEAAAM